MTANPEEVETQSLADAISAFLAAVHAQEAAGASNLVRVYPRITDVSLHVAAVLGLTDNARRLIAEDPSRVTARAGDPAADPLLYLCYSPFHGESDARDEGLLATARLLLASGANPNTTDSHYGVPALYAVTGVRSVLPVARLLLDAGANPTDGESVFHAAERFHEDALELLLSAGADVNFTGEWGNTPLYFLLRWWDIARHPETKQGMMWLLRHGADPNVLCGQERETSLHVAARRGQSVDIIRLLLDHGADVNTRRADGKTPWLLARRGGFDEIASMLENAGAETEPLSAGDLLLAACGRGDTDAARRLGSHDLVATLSPADLLVLPEAAASGRAQTVLACIAAGFPVNATDASGATALHYSTIQGRAKQVRALLAAGADTSIRDRQHSSTPLGWACYGADFSSEPDAEYEECVRALLDAGARPPDDEHQPKHEGVRRAIRQFESA
ncbi:MAG TPA: ankyrin repeat domain-containing protein [Gemmatimonadaceae bacterium]|nr:ankyrin repeat domain-containing protein [Gemmatimonadaceae bacterium]